MESKDLPNYKRSMSSDMTLISKEPQQKKLASARELKIGNVAPARKEAYPTVREPSVVVMDEEDEVYSGSYAVEEKSFSQATADFKCRFRGCEYDIKGSDCRYGHIREQGRT